MEVSEASSIVHEAADEDANIIFGAVVDPALKGRVKITVIATGFGPHVGTRPAGSVARTPVDLTQYGDGVRLRGEPQAVAPPPGGDRLALRRLSPGRRPVVEMPAPLAAPQTPPNLVFTDSPTMMPEEDVDPAFDVPAFLRRQEG